VKKHICVTVTVAEDGRSIMHWNRTARNMTTGSKPISAITNIHYWNCKEIWGLWKV